jgi:hypothetical protein
MNKRQCCLSAQLPMCVQLFQGGVH